MNIRESLNKLDHKAFDNETKFYDLVTLYESVSLNENEKKELCELCEKEDSEVIYDYLYKKLNGEDESLSEARSYGGAFDISDDQLFTREDLDDFGYRIVDELNAQSNSKFEYAGCWVDGSILSMKVEFDDGYEVEAEVRIDYRKLNRKNLDPATALYDYYASDIIQKLTKEARESGADIGWKDESLDKDKIRNRLDHFAGQITINKEDEKDMKDLLNKKNISFMIDDSKPGKLTFKLKYPDSRNSYESLKEAWRGNPEDTVNTLHKLIRRLTDKSKVPFTGHIWYNEKGSKTFLNISLAKDYEEGYEDTLQAAKDIFYTDDVVYDDYTLVIDVTDWFDNNFDEEDESLKEDLSTRVSVEQLVKMCDNEEGKRKLQKIVDTNNTQAFEELIEDMYPNGIALDSLFNLIQDDWDLVVDELDLNESVNESIGNDREYDEKLRQIDKDAYDIYKRPDDKSPADILREKGYEEEYEQHIYWKDDGIYTFVFDFTEYDDSWGEEPVKYYVLKDHIIPSGYTYTKTRIDEGILKKIGSGLKKAGKFLNKHYGRLHNAVKAGINAFNPKNLETRDYNFHPSKDEVRKLYKDNAENAKLKTQVDYWNKHANKDNDISSGEELVAFMRKQGMPEDEIIKTMTDANQNITNQNWEKKKEMFIYDPDKEDKKNNQSEQKNQES